MRAGWRGRTHERSDHDTRRDALVYLGDVWALPPAVGVSSCRWRSVAGLAVQALPPVSGADAVPEEGAEPGVSGVRGGAEVHGVPRDEDGVSEPLLFAASVDGLGRLKFDAPELRQHALAQLAGKRVVEHIKRERLTRSVEQNRALWGVYGDAVAEGVELVELSSGQPVFRTSEDVHNWAKFLLLRRPVMTRMGEVNLVGTTTTLSTEEFSKYIELLVAKLAQYGVFIPPSRT